MTVISCLQLLLVPADRHGSGRLVGPSSMCSRRGQAAGLPAFAGKGVAPHARCLAPLHARLRACWPGLPAQQLLLATHPQALASSPAHKPLASKSTLEPPATRLPCLPLPPAVDSAAGGRSSCSSPAREQVWQAGQRHRPADGKQAPRCTFPCKLLPPPNPPPQPPSWSAVDCPLL